MTEFKQYQKPIRMNKLIICVSVFLFVSIRLFAQKDCLDKIALQAVEISKLKDEVKQAKELLTGKQNDLQVLRKDSASNSVKLKGCDSSLIIYKVRKEKLDSTVNELERVNNKFLVLENSKKNLEKDNSELVSVSEKLKKIINYRYLNSFDALVKTSTLQSLENDLMVVETLSTESKLIEKINKLKIYKQAELLLGEKFNESKIEDSKNSLEVYKKEKPFASLNALLNDYKKKNEAVKQLLSELQGKNLEKSKVPALILEKKERTMFLIDNYVIDLYSIDLKQYSYLNQIIGEIKALKLQNVDADVLDFLKRL